MASGGGTLSPLPISLNNGVPFGGLFFCASTSSDASSMRMFADSPAIAENPRGLQARPPDEPRAPACAPSPSAAFVRVPTPLRPSVL